MASEEDEAKAQVTRIKQHFLELARAGDLEELRELVEKPGVPLNRSILHVEDQRGKGALIYAAAYGNLSVVDYLLTREEIDVNAVDDTQKSALHHAAKMAKPVRDAGGLQQPAIALSLIHAKANIEERDQFGCTPLIYAVAIGVKAIVQVLLDAGANVNASDYQGHAVMDYAAKMRHEEITNALRRRGARGNFDDTDDDVSELNRNGSVTKGRRSTGTRSVGTKESNSSLNPAKPVKTPTSNASMGPTKSKKVAAAGKKKGTKKKVNSKAAANKRNSLALAELNLQVEDASSIAVATGDNDVEVAESKLRYLLTDRSAMPSDLQAAIEVAKVLNCDAALISQAEAKEQALTEKTLAREILLDLVEKGTKKKPKDGDVAELQQAIAKCVALGVDAALVCKAQEKLDEQLPRQQAMDALAKAQEDGCPKGLQAAVEQAQKAGVTKKVLEPYEALLKASKETQSAKANLAEAVKHRDLHKLKFAIKAAKDARCTKQDIEHAEMLFQKLEKTANVEKALKKAMKGTSQEDLADAVRAAKDAGISESLIKDAEVSLSQMKERVRLMNECARLVEESKSVDLTSEKKVMAIKAKLQEAIVAAKAVNVPESELVDFDVRRRKLHNIVEDLKGSIRVFCRIRPLSSKEKNNGDENATQRVDAMTLQLDTDRGPVAFSFDDLFMPGTQEEVFDDCKDLVQSATDGYNVTLFAYGQTGAGKTYTMGGTPDNPGVSRRTIDELFRLVEVGKGRYHYTVMGSMIELYKTDVFDLLDIAKRGRDNVEKLKVRIDKKGSVVVEGLTEQECRTSEELYAILESGISARKVVATKMNPESSRSHLVFMVKVVSVNIETRAKIQGKLLIVDLAGSERIGKSEVTGDNAKDATAINMSLTALGDVIEGLTRKETKVIPYRNHTLTMLMQDALGGSAKTLMFVNCSPARSNLDETQMSLKWAQRAKNIKKPKAEKSKG